MTDPDLTDQGISVLVEIARTSGADLTTGQRLELDRLISEGLVALQLPAGLSDRRTYKVTAKGQRLLDERGVGANES
ncbi:MULTISPECIES: hypothetical protein [Rhodopseudomonas]|uniref:Uncharacterized protein n=1 Tax=Rhodopseudomonas palustris TaxID=1076 RepID=A0A0D7EFV5_RHOPL|nr:MULTISPECIES: hypothetical protein [Rhodopseudomonas]KIZ39623.1 hypothetical protein OO17_19890 [Rhodopseudomonas palustris]MDF3809963.1 hypothetical protein [Rhodopseudomonas sp. BAL398]WOK20477.1 hypothetical protein RBJ75_13565 [Rhodopseudomonas sp. BAL398]